MRACVAFLALSVFLPIGVAQQRTAPQLAERFRYDEKAPLDIKQVSVEQRGQAKVYDITYASPKGGRVPAYLVVPSGRGKFAAIIWGHWLMPGSSTANRSEFLDEAVALAPAGVVSLLIDAPYARSGFTPDPNPLSPQGPQAALQEVVDLRRGLDLLLARDDVDPGRVGFVGHSFNASCGAAFDAVDKRVKAFVFMGSPAALHDQMFSDDPRTAAFRKSVGDAAIEQYLKTYAWADPASYAPYLGPAPALFQYARQDEFISVPAAQHYFDMAQGPKELKFYDSKHALDAGARRDRYEWLRTKLKLGNIPSDTLAKVPQTK